MDTKPADAIASTSNVLSLRDGAKIEDEVKQIMLKHVRATKSNLESLLVQLRTLIMDILETIEKVISNFSEKILFSRKNSRFKFQEIVFFGDINSTDKDTAPKSRCSGVLDEKFEQSLSSIEDIVEVSPVVGKDTEPKSRCSGVLDEKFEQSPPSSPNKRKGETDSDSECVRIIFTNHTDHANNLKITIFFK